jgi:hypothetical protein
MDIVTALPRETSEPGGKHDRIVSPTAPPLPRWRMYALRAVYLYLVVGLALTRWPAFLTRDEPLPLIDGVVDTMLVALSVLFLIGVRYPVKMLPVLLFESAWKLIWLGTVALPLWATDRLTPAFSEMAFVISWVAPVLLVMPWGYVFRQFARAGAERSR